MSPLRRLCGADSQRRKTLPVQLPTKFGFVINLKAANALGINPLPTLPALADEIIEPSGARSSRAQETYSPCALLNSSSAS